MHHNGLRPFVGLLIIYHHVWLWQKSLEAFGNPHLLGSCPCILSTTGTPAVENGSLSMQFTNMCDDRWNWNPLGTRAANQCVIDINKDV